VAVACWPIAFDIDCRRVALFSVIDFVHRSNRFHAFIGIVQNQSTSSIATPQAGVYLVKLLGPVYPTIAHTAGIHGDVELKVWVRQDGSFQSADVVSGPPLLRKAALESAQQSQFECRGCTDSVNSYSLVYTFQFSNENCCNTSNAASVSESQNHVWITTSPFCFCDAVATLTYKARSMKCLYLWKCATRTQ
jgi:hypothetical protein